MCCLFKKLCPFKNSRNSCYNQSGNFSAPAPNRKTPCTKRYLENDVSALSAQNSCCPSCACCPCCCELNYSNNYDKHYNNDCTTAYDNCQQTYSPEEYCKSKDFYF